MFGQFGPIDKIQVNSTKPFVKKDTGKLNYSAYITYKNEISSCLAILAVQKTKNINIECSFGNNKYCKFFLANIKCKKKNSDCLFLHEFANPQNVYYHDDGVGEYNQGKKMEIFKFQRKFARKIAAQYFPEILLIEGNKSQCMFQKINGKFKRSLKLDLINEGFIDSSGNALIELKNANFNKVFSPGEKSYCHPYEGGHYESVRPNENILQ